MTDVFRPGEPVVYVNTPQALIMHKHVPTQYPEPGTVGIIHMAGEYVCSVKWPADALSEGYVASWMGSSYLAPLPTDDAAAPAPSCPVIEDSGDRTEFATGAVRDMHAGKGRMDLLPWLAIIEVSRHCENGALKYGEHNVDRGIPAHSLLDSGMRHAAKFLSGETDEDHLLAACWNFLWALQMRQTNPDLMDVPWNPE